MCINGWMDGEQLNYCWEDLCI